MFKGRKISRTHFFLVVIIVFQLIMTWGMDHWQMKVSVPMALLLSQLTIILPFIIYCLVEKQNPLKLIRFKKIRPISIFFAFIIALFSYPVVIFLNMISMLFVENAMTDVMPAVLEMGLLPGLLFMALMPAVVEETIFRGMLYNQYAKYRPVAGIILSAVLFGLMHMNFNQMPYAIYLGIIMALLLEVTDSIIAPMVIHFTMNASSTILVFLSQEMLEMTGETQNTDLISSFKESFQMTMEQTGVELSAQELEGMFPIFLVGILLGAAFMAGIALILVFVLINALARINGRPLKTILKKKETEEKVRFVDIWLILFVIYTLYQCIVSIGI